jgi:hypothetical protein
MGLLWRLFAPKPLKMARRTVRKATHPVHTAVRAATPKPVKQLQRTAHPIGVAQLKTEDAAVKAVRGDGSKPKRSQRAAAGPKKGSSVQPAAESRRDSSSQRGRSRMSIRPVPDGGPDTTVLGGAEDLEVVGESYYQENLWRLVAPRRPGDDVHQDLSAILVAEYSNPYDSDAVAVHVQNLIVGHLPRQDARRYRPGLLRLQERYGQPIALSGFIAGGGVQGNRVGQLGIFLRHDPADFGLPGGTTGRAGIGMFSPKELEDARLAYLRNYNYRTMNCGRGSAEIVRIDGTMRFQDALKQAATRPRPWRHEMDRHLPAVLVREPDDREAVAVLIDGNVVGFLARDVAGQHAQQLDDLESSGQHLVCSALIVGGDAGKNFGIRLQIKPEVGRRWASGAKLPAGN